MAFDLSAITVGGQPKPPRIYLLGVEGIGKTTFAAKCKPNGEPTKATEKTLVVPMASEQGLEGLPVPQTPPVRCFGDLMEIFASLYEEAEAGNLPFDTIVLDSVSALEEFIIKEALDRDPNADTIEKLAGGYGKQEMAINAVWGEVLGFFDTLRDMGVGCVLVGHTKVRKARDPLVSEDYDTYEADLRFSSASLIQRWADAVLFATYKVAVNSKTKRGVGKGVRVLHTQKRPGHPGKVRQMFGNVPAELPFSWEEWDAAISEKPENEEE